MLRVTSLVFLFSVFSFSQGLQIPHHTSFIVNGTRAEKNQFPFIVSIRVGGEHNCGGAIIDKRWIITAAHCAKEDFDIDILSVVAGSVLLTGFGDDYALEKKIPHPFWNEHANLNDIALLKTDRDIEFAKESVQIIPLASSEDVVPDGAEIIVAGWGYTKYPNSQASDHLLFTNVSVVNRDQCQQRWGKKTVIIPQYICVHNTEHTGTCLGDSGGPYVLGGKLVGVHIFGDWCKLEKPSVATRVSEYLDWIANEMKDNS